MTRKEIFLVVVLTLAFTAWMIFVIIDMAK